MSCTCNHNHDSENQQNQYAAKLVCGRIEKDLPLLAGTYRTSINIHNPSPCENADLQWKVAISIAGKERSVTTPFQTASLAPDQAMQIDCEAVARALKAAGFSAAFNEGWVVIQSEPDLDVVAVYTGGEKEALQSIHTERVCARRVPRCVDMIMDLSTGVAPWVLTAPDDGGELATLGSQTTAWANLAGASWINDPDQTRQAAQVYEVCFDLCFGFESPELTLTLLADNRARAELNGHILTGSTYTTANGTWHTTNNADFTTPVTVSAQPHMFQAGRNCLRLTVWNDNGPTGVAAQGTLFVPSGRCPGSPVPRIPCPGVCYQAYRRTIGWVGPNCNGETIGIPDPTTIGKRRTKAFRAYLTNSPPGTDLRYRGVTNSGTTNWVSQGQVCGSTGATAKLYQMEFELQNAPPHCRLEYRVNSRKGGWSGWMSSGMAGTNKDRVDAFEIRIV